MRKSVNYHIDTDRTVLSVIKVMLKLKSEILCQNNNQKQIPVRGFSIVTVDKRFFNFIYKPHY